MQATYVRAIWITKRRINDTVFLPLLGKLSTQHEMENNIGKSHLSSSALYSSKYNEAELIVGTGNYFIKRPTNSPLCHALSFYSAVKTSFTKLCMVYTELCSRSPYFFPVFHVSEVAGQCQILWNGQAVVFEQDALAGLRPYAENRSWENDKNNWEKRLF